MAADDARCSPRRDVAPPSGPRAGGQRAAGRHGAAAGPASAVRPGTCETRRRHPRNRVLAVPG